MMINKMKIEYQKFLDQRLRLAKVQQQKNIHLYKPYILEFYKLLKVINTLNFYKKKRN